MVIAIGLPHYLPLVGLSILLAILGGYVGLGLAAQARDSLGLRRRVMLAGAAWALGLGIWTMHFVGILAVRFPSDVAFSVLQTLMSFLLCVLVVGIACFLRSDSAGGRFTSVLSSAVMGGGIVSMHYIGMHAISGDFGMSHDSTYTAAAALLAMMASYAALKLIETQTKPIALAVSAGAFGLAVSGMHYTAMAGMTLTPQGAAHHDMGLTISSDILTIAVSVLAFLISGFFLLYLVPESKKAGMSVEAEASGSLAPAEPPAALPPQKAPSIPIETDGTTRFLPSDSVCAIHATTHYTLIYDGEREYFSPWSISRAEQLLPMDDFMRVHRSHIIAVDKIVALRRAGDGAAVEVGQPKPRVVPVSRSHYAELKSRLGLRQKMRGHVA